MQEAMSGFEQFQKPAVYSIDSKNAWTSARSTGGDSLESLLDGPRLARKIFRLDITQLVCGVVASMMQ